MSNPNDDTDIPSGLNDDAERERTSPRARQMVISSPAPAPTSAQTASPRTLGAADEEDGFTVEGQRLVAALRLRVVSCWPKPTVWRTVLPRFFPSLAHLVAVRIISPRKLMMSG